MEITPETAHARFSEKISFSLFTFHYD